MAIFRPAFRKTMQFEGGYHLTFTNKDRGGTTYAGISRVFHPEWIGWRAVDKGEKPSDTDVENFYYLEYWLTVHADKLDRQETAWAIFDYAVNAGTKTAVRAVQRVVGVEADGIIGPVTIAAINTFESPKLENYYALARIAHYNEIALRDLHQKQFLIGWVRRALAGAKIP